MPSFNTVDAHPALLLKRGEERVLVVGDLHIGWEVTLAQQGIHVPSQTGRLLEKLSQVIQAANPTRLVFLGDVKHTVVGAEIEEWRDVPEFFEKVVELVPQVEIIQGNHDGNLEPLTPRQVKFFPATGLALWETFGLFHGHAWPAPELMGCETLIMGHLHPAVVFVDALGYRMTRPVWVRSSCDPQKLAKGVLRAANVKVKTNPLATLKETFRLEARTTRCVFVPPFNDFLGGRPVNTKTRRPTGKLIDEQLGPLLKGEVVDFESAEVHLLDGTYLGTVGQLRAFAG